MPELCLPQSVQQRQSSATEAKRLKHGALLAHLEPAGGCGYAVFAANAFHKLRFFALVLPDELWHLRDKVARLAYVP